MLRAYKKFITAAMLTVLMPVFAATAGYANDSSMGRTPDGVFPMQENDVVMESEEITVDLGKNTAECIFVFHNTGESKNVLMGFPGKAENNEDGLTDPDNLEIKNFKAYVNGKGLKVTNEKNTENVAPEASSTLKYSTWFTFDVHFKADERLTIRNTYSFVPSFNSMGDISTGYVIKTGMPWKGPIGSSKVIFKLGEIKPYQIESLKPGGFKYAGNNLVWERKDFEPEYNLSVVYNNWRYSREYSEGGYVSDEENAKIQKKIAEYKNVKLLSDKGKTYELLRLYKTAIDENNYLLALYIRGMLPGEDISEPKPVLGDIKVEKMDSGHLISGDIKFAEIAFINMSVSHFESGKEVVDLNDDFSGCIFTFSPGIEYNIRYILKDWMGDIQQKEMKFMIPDEQPSPLTAALEKQEPLQEQSAGLSSVAVEEKSEEKVEKKVEDKKDVQDGRIYAVGISIGISLLGLLAAGIIFAKKSKIRHHK